MRRLRRLRRRQLRIGRVDVDGEEPTHKLDATGSQVAAIAKTVAAPSDINHFVFSRQAGEA